jgi:amidase
MRQTTDPELRGRVEGVSRRTFMKGTVVTAAAVAAAGGLPSSSAQTAAPATDPTMGFRWAEATMADMQAAMGTGELTARRLVRDYIERIEAIDWSGIRLNSIIELNPDAEAVARDLDRERTAGHIRGPLHGIPVVLKDCVATADRMQTTAGSLALLGARYPRDAGIVRTLRQAGAVLLGKTNMSEFNGYFGWPNRGGWSARAGIGLNPYAIDSTTGVSSSGSAAALAANLTAGAVGLETYGSIVVPAALSGVVGLKPTLGLTSRSGTIGISFSRDVVGPMGRTVSDVATLLGGMVGVDPRDSFTSKSARHLHPDYRRFLDPDGLRGARIGLWRGLEENPDNGARKVVFHAMRRTLPDLGASVVEPIEIPLALEAIGPHIGVMLHEFSHRINDYLAELTNTDIHALRDIVRFNEEHAEQELRWQDQVFLSGSLTPTPLSDPNYLRDRRRSRALAREAFTEAMDRHRLDAIVAPTYPPAGVIDLLNGDSPILGPLASGGYNAAGYPAISVPAGFVGELPVGALFIARAWEEPKLLRFAYAFEQAAQVRRPPRFLTSYGSTDFVPR